MNAPPAKTERERAADIGRAVHARLKMSRDHFVSLLRDLVLAESPSTVPESQAEVRVRLEVELCELGFDVEYTPGETTGGVIRARVPGAGGRSRQLILAHMDTVWDLGTLARMPAETDGTVFRGPGSFDMKGGITMALCALRALRDEGVELEVSPVFMITSDEEIGSPESEGLILEEAQAAQRVFVVEPALDPEGLIKTRRKCVGQSWPGSSVDSMVYRIRNAGSR